MKKNKLFFWFFLPFIFLIIIVVFILVPIESNGNKNRNENHDIVIIDNYSSVELKLKKGDSFFSILNSHGFSAKEILILTKLLKKNRVSINKLPIGSKITIFFSALNPFSIDVLTPKKDNFFCLLRNDAAIWEFSSLPIPITKSFFVKDFTIKSSLYGAFKDANEGEGLMYQLVDILKWDVDFFRDVRKNDKIKIIFEKIQRGEDRKCYDKIIALIYNGERISENAYYFKMGKSFGFFDEKGQSMKKAFLKYPLKFSRISSRYTNRRYHPILHIYRPHHGIDYAAPTGTPVHAIGDGVIERRGWAGGAGKSVRIRHANGYKSYYNHFSRFAYGIRVGKKVKMGQTIGYVGMTGLSTGPHLDFRVKKNGKWVNPLRLKRGKGKPLQKKYRAKYKKYLLDIDQIFQTSDVKNYSEKITMLVDRYL
jgi:murein DD-endopeptidase MepM/ murein hydrolase activator NlpD